MYNEVVLTNLNAMLLRSFTIAAGVVLGVAVNAAEQSRSLRDKARVQGGKADVLFDVDVPFHTMPQLAPLADYIVQARIIEKRGVLSTDETSVITEYQIVPTRVLKDAIGVTMSLVPGPSIPLTVRHTGGRLKVDGLELSTSSNLYPIDGFAVGQEFIMFLQDNAPLKVLELAYGPAGIYQLTGGFVDHATDVGPARRQPRKPLTEFVAELSSLVATHGK
jgi:hypothetical protein